MQDINDLDKIKARSLDEIDKIMEAMNVDVAIDYEIYKEITEFNALEIIAECHRAAITNVTSKLPNDLLNCSYIDDNGTEHLLMANHSTRHFFNFLGNYAKNVLEIGTFLGGSALAFAYNNDNFVTTIDNFSEEHGQMSIRARMLYHLAYVDNIRFIETDALTYNYSELNKKFDMIFLDGHHGYEQTYIAVKKVSQVMADVCLMIVDDWNLHPVQRGTLEVLDTIKTHDIKFKLHLHGNCSTAPDSFWNGMELILLVKKQNDLPVL